MLRDFKTSIDVTNLSTGHLIVMILFLLIVMTVEQNSLNLSVPSQDQRLIAGSGGGPLLTVE